MDTAERLELLFPKNRHSQLQRTQLLVLAIWCIMSIGIIFSLPFVGTILLAIGFSIAYTAAKTALRSFSLTATRGQLTVVTTGLRGTDTCKYRSSEITSLRAMQLPADFGSVMQHCVVVTLDDDTTRTLADHLPSAYVAHRIAVRLRTACGMV